MNNNVFEAGLLRKASWVAPGVARDYREDPSGPVSGVRRSTAPPAGGGFVTSPDDAMLSTLASVTAAGLAWIAQHTEDTLVAVHRGRASPRGSYRVKPYTCTVRLGGVNAAQG